MNNMDAAQHKQERKQQGKGDLYKGVHFSRNWGLWLKRDDKKNRVRPRQMLSPYSNAVSRGCST